MTETIRRHRGKLAALVLAGAALWIAAAGLRAGNAYDGPPYEQVLVMRGIAFQAGGSGPPNPALELRRGQPVRLVIRNQEPGAVLHCFTIPGLGVKTSGSLVAGESEVLEFVPRSRGTYSYACLLHPGMTGKIVVR